MSFDVSKTGFILPDNWQFKRIGDIADVNARTIRKDNEPQNIHYIDISSVSTGRLETPKLMEYSSGSFENVCASCGSLRLSSLNNSWISHNAPSATAPPTIHLTAVSDIEMLMFVALDIEPKPRQILFDLLF